MNATAIPAHIAAAFDADDRIITVREYNDGFVPNSYRWPAPGTYTEWSRDGSVTEGKYDRKRSGGKGSTLVGRSAKGGTLYSR